MKPIIPANEILAAQILATSGIATGRIHLQSSVILETKLFPKTEWLQPQQFLTPSENPTALADIKRLRP